MRRVNSRVLSLELKARLFVGFVASLAAEGVQRWFYGPRLIIDYGTTDGYRARTDVGDPKIADAIYVRLRVRNVKPRLAKGCRAYLTKIERRKSDLSWEDTIFDESIQLSWSSQGSPFSPLDIPRGIDQYVDLLSVRHPVQGPPVREFTPCLSMLHFRFRHLWAYQGTYRMTVLGSELINFLV